METWKPCAGFADGYEVSDQGRVRSWRSRNGRGGLTKAPRLLDHGKIHGYPVVCLQRGPESPTRQSTPFVHTLVLEAFVGPCPEGMECRHFPDRTRTNVRLENLQWGTAFENAQDRDVHGMTPRGDRHWSCTKPESVIRGDAHPSHVHPERLPRGDAHWTRRRPDRLIRGDAHHSRRNPECMARGEKHSASMRGVARGERNARVRISEETAQAIIAELSRKVPKAELARKYASAGATIHIVSDIGLNRSWVHLVRPWLKP